jgi:hypothetical protein
MTQLSSALVQSFAVAATELGFCSAAWLFAQQVAAHDGDAGVQAMRDALGRTYPVLDAVCAAWLDGERQPVIDTAAVVQALHGAKTLVIVGFESSFLDALLPQLPDREVYLLAHGSVDDLTWGRMLANFDSRVRSVDLVSFQRLAGSQTALLCMVYGATEHAVHVPPAWLRLFGDDVRAQFRSFVGWDVLRRGMYVYPRWLIEAPRRDFTRIV